MREIILIPPLNPAQIHQTEAQEHRVISDGFIGFSFAGIMTDDHGRTEIYDWNKTRIGPNVDYIAHGFFAETWESLYQYWALIVAIVGLVIAAVSLGIIAVEKIYPYFFT